MHAHFNRLRKSKAGTARAVVHQEFGVRGTLTTMIAQSHYNFSPALNQNTCLYAGVYTIEASFLGGDEVAFKGLHYTSVDYEEIGASICRAILDFSDGKKQASTLEVVAKDQDGVGNENSSDSVCCGMHVHRRSMRFV